MAKVRMVHTRFWNDTFVAALDPIEKLLFNYFLTNEHTSICGIYELPLKVAALETGIDEDMFKKIFRRLKPKVFYKKGWVIVVNFPKYQNLNLPKVKQGFHDAISAIPKDILDFAKDNGFAMNCQYIANGLETGNSDSNLNSERELNTTAEQSSSRDVPEVINLFRDVNPSYQQLFGMQPQRKATERLLEQHGKEKLISMISFLPKSNSSRYAPTITTPAQFEANLGRLIAWAQKQKDSGKAREFVI